VSRFFPPSQLPEMGEPATPKNEEPATFAERTLRQRLLVLALFAACGLTVSAAGYYLSGSILWFLALPLALLLGWPSRAHQKLVEDGSRSSSKHNHTVLW
jgi:hypothetical protein